MAKAGARSDAAFNPKLVASVAAMVRRRVPASEVDDIVQSALTDAVASAEAPSEPDAFERWLGGIVRHKVADFHRRRMRERTRSGLHEDDLSELAQSNATLTNDESVHQDRDMLRWADRHLPQGDDARRTFEWMLHEADGEKLESIAAREEVPAARVRQRVHRLRAFFRERWSTELAAIATIILVAIFGWLLSRQKTEAPIANEPPAPSVLPPIVRAQETRRRALEACDAGEWDRCIRGLDEAKALDPAGDTLPEVLRAREAAPHPTTEEPTAPAPTPAPSASVGPRTPVITPAPRPTSVPSVRPMPTEAAPGPRTTDLTLRSFQRSKPPARSTPSAPTNPSSL